MSAGDLSEVSMHELFRMEAEGQAQVLTSGLLVLERDNAASDQLDACMRAAHSLKGAARIIGLTVGVRVAHALEDCFVAAQQGRVTLRQKQIDVLLHAVDLLTRIAKTDESELGQWNDQQNTDVQACLSALEGVLEQRVQPETTESKQLAAEEPPVSQKAPAEPKPSTVGRVLSAFAEAPADRRSSESGGRSDPATQPEPQTGTGAPMSDTSDRVLRVTAESLNRLLGLASESLVKMRWVKPFSGSLLRLKRLHHDAVRALDTVAGSLASDALDEGGRAALAHAQSRLQECQQLLTERLGELEMFDRRAIGVLHRLYDEALACRMRPFADGIQGLPRLVRAVARSLGKQVRLEIIGETTQVDRDILARLDAPLGHLLRNAVDHGIESPEERRAAGKLDEGTLRLEARHSGGTLQIILTDDGRGVDLDRLRAKIIARKLINEESAHALSEAELLEFLFLPGFTLKESVSDISGRGVGLDAVQDMVKQVRGTVHVTSRAGRGTQFRLKLPVALSVLRTLLADIGGEPYAFPLAFIVSAVDLPREEIDVLEGRQHFDFEGRRVGLVTAHQVLGTAEPSLVSDRVPVVVVGDANETYGVIVDRFLGERELVVQPLDAHLGKIKDISAGSLMDDGSPVLIVDAADMLRSVSKLASDGYLATVTRGTAAGAQRKRKRVLVVDDSLTVRELERKLLTNFGYDVEIAVDGMDGWNAVRTGHFDLVVTDVDMPRMDGIELVTLINKDPNLKSLPVMIVSYKDRDEDRQRGLEAGAAYYLTKGSFHDETLVNAVVDLIGEAAA